LLVALHQSSIDSQQFVENRNLCLPHLYSTPPLGVARQNIAMTFGMDKLECCGYPAVTNFGDTFIRFDRIHERDGQTDGRTDTHNGIGRACIASRQKQTVLGTTGQ